MATAKPKRAKAPRTVPEESVFKEYDEIADRIADRLGRYINRLFRVASESLDAQRLAAAQSLESPSLVNQAGNWIALEASFRQHLAPPPKEPEKEEQKARRRGAPLSDPFASLDPSGLIQEAVDAGIELGIRTLPTQAARDSVDVAKARRRAYATLNRDLIKQSLNALNESRGALAMLVDHPKHLMGDVGDDVRAALDGRTMQSLFGLDKRQAQALVRELGDMAARKIPKRELRAYALRRYRQMLKIRIDLLAKTISNEAVNKGQRAAWAEAKAAGDLRAGYLKEWVARILPCPRCLAFDGKRAPIDKPFVSDLGETAMEPEIHPRGRCRMRLVKPRTATGTTERSRRLRRSA